MSNDELLAIPNFGKVCLGEVERLIRNQSWSDAPLAVPGQSWRPQSATQDREDSADQIPSDREIGIASLPISRRSFNCLVRAEINTVWELRQLSDDELLSLPNFGQRSLLSVRDALRNLSLDASPMAPPVDPPGIDDLILTIAESIPHRDLEYWRRRYGLRSGIPETLSALAEESQVTRERVRQIVSRCDLRMTERSNRLGGPVNSLIEDLGTRTPTLTIVDSWTSFRSSFRSCIQQSAFDRTGIKDVFISPESLDILLWLTGPYSTIPEDGRRTWLGKEVVVRTGRIDGRTNAIMNVHRRYSPQVGEFLTTDVLREVLRLLELIDPAAPETDVELIAARVYGLTEYGELGWGLPNQSAAVLLKGALKKIGEPCSAERLREFIGSSLSVRYLKNCLGSDSAIVRVGIGMYALDEWNIEAYLGISDEIATILEDNGGSAALSEVISQLSMKGVAETSVHIHASGPRFQLRHGNIGFRLSTESDSASRSLSARSGWWRISESKIAWRFLVDRDVLRGSGIPIGVTEAAALGVQYCNNRQFLHHPTGSKVTVDYNKRSIHPACSSLRLIAESNNLREGDWCILHFDTSDGTVESLRAPDQRDSSLAAKVEAHTGLLIDATDSIALVLSEYLDTECSFGAVMDALMARRLMDFIVALSSIPTLPYWPSPAELAECVIGNPSRFGLFEEGPKKARGRSIVTRPLCNPFSEVIVDVQFAGWTRGSNSNRERGFLTLGDEIPEFAHSRSARLIGGFAEDLDVWIVVDCDPSSTANGEYLPDVLWTNETTLTRVTRSKSGMATSHHDGITRIVTRSENLGEALDELSRSFEERARSELLA